VDFVQTIQVVKPRVPELVQQSSIREATLAAEKFFYSWPTKNRDGSMGLVEGTTIDGAMILLRNFGNCATKLTVEEHPMHWIFSAAVIDLEKGTGINRMFRQRKGQTTMKDRARGDDIDFQIGQSKALRNVILAYMPSYVVERCMDAAKDACEASVGDIATAIDKAVKAFAAFGVTEQMLVWKFGVPRSQWIKRDVVYLRALHKALKDRVTSVAGEFEGYEDPNAPKSDTMLAAPRAETPAPTAELPSTFEPPVTDDEPRKDFE
jgi:hypothetical protein